MNAHTLPQPSHIWNGTTYRTLLSTAETEGRMSIVHGVAGPLEGPPMHVHAGEDETFFILEGAIDFELDGTRFRRGPMEVAFVPRGVLHSFRTGPDGATCITVMTPGGFEGFFEEMAAGGLELPRDIAAVTACALRLGSRITGPGLAQRAEMRDIAFVFLVAAVLCVTGGMVWGIQMAISEDHLMAPAHAHLNLIGWVTLAVFGLYYRQTPRAASGALPWIHAAVAILGVALIVPGIAMAIAGGSPALAAVGSLLSLASMGIFLFTVLRFGFGAAG